MSQSAVSRAASLLFVRNDDEEADFGNPGLFAMSVRLPSNIASLVSAMADNGKCSRNEMANLIVEAGIDAILSAIPSELAADIQHDAQSNITDFIS